MPNWTQNFITLEGEASALQEIYDVEFNFQKLHPCPFIHDINTPFLEGWYEWCCKHWGTKWSASDNDIEYSEGDTTLTAHLATAWHAPHAFLTYLTTIYPSLTITNEWSTENYETIGITVYAHGTMNNTQIDPSNYTVKALEEFAILNTWFSYDEYSDYVDESENSNGDDEINSEVEVKEDQVIPKQTHYTYAELIA
jgi:hypothetical protein